MRSTEAVAQAAVNGECLSLFASLPLLLLYTLPFSGLEKLEGDQEEEEMWKGREGRLSWNI